MEIQRRNIVLIGMPGVGKSTIGVLLAKALGRYFLDTDVFIQAVQGRSLQEIIDAEGLAAFCKIEEDYATCIDLTNAVIATGGSVVYSEQAMRSLAERGVIGLQHLGHARKLGGRQGRPIGALPRDQHMHIAKPLHGGQRLGHGVGRQMAFVHICNQKNGHVRSPPLRL